MQHQLQSQLQLMSKQLEVVQGSNLSTEQLSLVENGSSHATHTTYPAPSPRPSSQSSSLSFWRFDPSSGKQLSTQQQSHLNALIARYTQRTRNPSNVPSLVDHFSQIKEPLSASAWK
jgi:hypothetical protein